ncbi:alpha/beta fold hydrolase [Corynebacterium sp. UBA2622]|uniref:alpha/beta fold hydrolase n=1 Tax=Corynebacterium sp. UBA2622 TaxID=1946393 RepID=UPI0025C24F85|nr:alpha/beta hydrolase [Corynebacterium sp. UBA2622]
MAKTGRSPKTVELEGPYAHQMLHTRGLRLHAATAGDPSGPLVLLLHGTFGGWFDFADILEPLAARGFHVAALDMRGYGMSDKPAQRGGDETLLAVGDVKGAIATLGHRSAVLAGADTGGSVAWATAAAHPGLVAGLVSVSAAHPADLRRSMASHPWDFLPLLGRLALSRLPAGAFPSGAKERAYRRNLLLNTDGGFHGTGRFDSTLDLRLRASEIDSAGPYIAANTRLLTRRAPAGPVTAPTLLLHAPLALWGPVATRQRRRLRGPVTEASIEGTKNLPHIERPAAFAETVARFATSLRPPRP